MINQAAEVIHYKNGSGVIIDHKPEIKMPHAKTMSDSGMKTSQEPPRKEKQSPSIGRRICQMHHLYLKAMPQSH